MHVEPVQLIMIRLVAEDFSNLHCIYRSTLSENLKNALRSYNINSPVTANDKSNFGFCC